MRRRTIVVPIIRNDQGDLLLCRMPPNRGVFPGQWGLAGGGIEDGESMFEALHREVREELGITVSKVTPLSFRDDVRTKRYADGTEEPLYLIYLLFECLANSTEVSLNDEFDAYAWVSETQLAEYDLNPATRLTFKEMKLMTLPPEETPRRAR